MVVSIRISRHGVLFLVDPFIHLRRGYDRPEKLGLVIGNKYVYIYINI